MTNDDRSRATLQDLVRGYYEDNALPETTVRRLTAAARRSSSPARRWGIAGGMAALLATVAFGLGAFGRDLLRTPGVDGSSSLTPKLVAVQIHADWCPRSPEVGPVFAELLTEYGNEPVLFVTLDITDDVRREQAKLLSSTLGISQAFDEPFGSGMIKLIDRQSHTLLAAITGREQADQLEIRLAEILEQRDHEAEKDKGGGA